MTTEEKIEEILSHIQRVQTNCYRLGLILLKNGEAELGKNLIANGQIHDNSKFKGFEFDSLFRNETLLKEAATHHAQTNPHHPEYWGTIHLMPPLYVAEMVCDWAARSSEFGTDLRDWIENKATKRYNFSLTSPIATSINLYTNLLLKPKF